MQSTTNNYVSVTFTDGEWKLKESEVPTPPAGQILIRVAYASVNPHDKLVFAMHKNEGVTNGSDGCGTIVAVGEGVSDSLIGKKVAFTGNSWS